MSRKHVAVLISGSGSNLQALIDACAASDYPAKIVLVLSNKADAYGLKRAEQAGISTEVIQHVDFPTRDAFDAAMQEKLHSYGVEIICLAGFMRILTPEFVAKWEGKMLNIHPSLLPSFKGLHTHKRALETGVKIHGCTVHYVNEELDSGAIILQAAIPVLPQDDETSLASRVLAAEHCIYPKALRWVCQNKIKAAEEQDSPTAILFSPALDY